MRNTNITLMSRLMGSACFISVDAAGNVTGSQPPMSTSAGGDVVAQGQSPEVSSKGAPRDPAAPPETDEEKAARLAAETPEEKTAREAAAAAEAAKTTEEETVEKTAEEKAAEGEAKNKAWAERDTTKDVPVTPEQTAQIKQMAATPEQEALLSEFTLETNTSGDLSPASRAKAAAAWGVKPEMVDAYVASVIAQNKGPTPVAQYDDTSDDMSKWSPALKGQYDARMTALHNVAGGEKNFTDFTKWAQDGGLNAAEIQAFSDAIQASPIVGATVAKGFLDRWKSEGNGGGPVDLTRAAPGGNKPADKVQGFASKAEQNAAIRDPKYSKDAAYRNAVDARIVVSNFTAAGVEKSFFQGGGGMMGT